MIYIPRRTYEMLVAALHPVRDKSTLQEQIERLWRQEKK